MLYAIDAVVAVVVAFVAYMEWSGRPRAKPKAPKTGYEHLLPPHWKLQVLDRYEAAARFRSNPSWPRLESKAETADVIIYGVSSESLYHEGRLLLIRYGQMIDSFSFGNVDLGPVLRASGSDTNPAV